MSVWVQLYYMYEGKYEPVGDPFQVYQSDMKPDRQMNIGALKEAVKDKMAEELTHCSAAKLVVYPPKSCGDREKQYKPGKKLDEVIAELENKKTPPTSDDHPFIVVAPAQQPAMPPLAGTPKTGHRIQHVPPSAGIARPRQIVPRKAPSSEEGRAEGLEHASHEAVKTMQCTSHPGCVYLLQLYEQAIKEDQTNSLKQEYHNAAVHVCRARRRLSAGDLPADIGTNERFFTGAMSSAMNSVLENGYFVLHQGCLGTGDTHSDLSAARIWDGRDWPKTLLVGEGKWNAGDLRAETRGQIFNELLRHRAIDRVGDYAPILLLAFDNKLLEVDLAFPSTSYGKLAQDGLVEFGNVAADSETFWTVRLLSISIDGHDGRKNLPAFFRFMAQGLETLYRWPQKRRVQFKIPPPLKMEDAHMLQSLGAFGDNVTLISGWGTVRVYKEFCYHLREFIDVKDRRRPPPSELLDALGHPYTDWEVYQGPFGISVLSYVFIEGSSSQPTAEGWLMILRQVESMHNAGFVHGDLLPRNVVFCHDGKGYVLDFDLTRKEGEPYVLGFNYSSFQQFRHKDALESKPMSKAHDLHSLKEMSQFFFPLSIEISDLTLANLIQFFNMGDGISARIIDDTNNTKDSA